MSWKHIFAKKDLEMLLAEMAGEHRLHRVLGPVGLTSLGIGCIIGAGIFVMTGRAAAGDAGPAVSLSFAIAGLGCAFAALCYAEFAAMAPVAGSAYTYAYTTLGEIFAWIIGWDLILEYAMGCATVASSWTYYLNELLRAVSGNRIELPAQIIYDPFTYIESLQCRGWLNLPSIVIVGLITVILVIGIRESVRTNAILVGIKLLVVVFVIIVGVGYVNSANWTKIPCSLRVLPEEHKIPELVKKYTETPLARDAEELAYQLAATENPKATPEELPQTESDKKLVAQLLPIVSHKENIEKLQEEIATYLAEQKIPSSMAPGIQPDVLSKQLRAEYRKEWADREAERLKKSGGMSEKEIETMKGQVVENVKDALPQSPEDKAAVDRLLPAVHRIGKQKEATSWGLLGVLGLNQWLMPIDDAMRTPFTPYGLSGLMLGASIVFFAYIGFDSISTHAEEAKNPHRDLPIGILVSLTVCTLLYVAVALVITGMIPYTDIDIKAPIAAAFREKAVASDSMIMKQATALISIGGLAGMTSVLLVLFLSQVRVLMAMARDGLLPKALGVVHPKFRTPHLATMITGLLICVAAAFTPIKELEEMVNIGTLMAFVIVCAAVLVLRVQRPDAKRPFRCPLIWVVAPLGMLVNASLMLFLPINTWWRLLIWLLLGFIVYFGYSRRHSHLTKHLMKVLQAPTDDPTVDLVGDENGTDAVSGG